MGVVPVHKICPRPSLLPLNYSLVKSWKLRSRKSELSPFPTVAETLSSVQSLSCVRLLAETLRVHYGIWVYHGDIFSSLVAQMAKNLPTRQETQVRFLGWEDPLEKKMATHSNILAWRSP